MKHFLLACCLFTSLLANRDTCPIPPTTVAIEPLGLLAGCVDVVTGSYIGSSVEVTVNCHEPIRLYRQLVTCGDEKGSTSFWQLGKEYLDFKAKRHAKGKDSRFRIIGEAGDIIEYVVKGPPDWGFQHRGVPFYLEVDPDQLLSNTSYGEISGRTNPRNNHLRYSAVSSEHAHYGTDAFTLHKGDGEVRIYTHGRQPWSHYKKWKKGENREPKQETFLLREVIRSNGNRIFYSYDGTDALTNIRSANRDDSQTFGWIQIQHGGAEKIVTTSDGQTVRIHTDTFSDPTNTKRTKELPRFIIHSDGIMEGFRYVRSKDKLALDAQSIQRRCFFKLEDHRFKNSQKIDCSRKTFSAPVGEGGAFERLYSLEVGGGIYHRVEIEGGRILYTVRGGQIESMMKHNQGDILPVNALSQSWSPEGNLACRRFTKYCVPYDFTDAIEEVFRYDKRHNVVERVLIGSLTGRIVGPLKDREGREQATTRYTYGELNLPLSEEKEGIRIVNEYRPTTDLLILRKIYENGELREEIALDYDKNAALISKIHKSGSLTFIEETKRREDGMPLEVIEKTPAGQLKRIVFHYNQRNHVIQTDHFDAKDHYLYSLFTEFDERGRVIAKIDSLGHKTRTTYDNFNNPSIIHLEGTAQELHFEYDQVNRLTQKSLHDLVTGEKQVEGTRFDKMSRQVALVTPLNTTITFHRDPHGRILEEQQEKIRTLEGWQSPKILREYDCLDRVIKEIDPQGGVTEIAYADRNDWCFKKYPDGTVERRYYTLQGQLEEEVHKDGNLTHYTRDYKGRILTQERRAPSGAALSQESFTYDGDLLLNHTDPLGFVTHYIYDDAGRLLSTRKEEALTEYIYDACGRKVTERSWSDPHHYTLTKLEYDLLDRVIAEQVEGETGKVYQRKETTYDLSGNPIKVSTLLSSTTTVYDSFNRPSRQVDQLGNATTFSYKKVLFEGQTVLLTITTDPLGRQAFLYQDGKGRTLRQEKKDENGALLSQVDHYYDLNGNEVKQEHRVVSQGKVLCTYAFGNTFGPGHLLLASTEGLNSANPRITQYTYDSCSRLQCTIKPDGTHLYRAYDALSRLATYEGPDFCYRYTYNAADDLIGVNDITRTYDAHHRLLSETTPSGTITYTRDWLGRRTQLHYLDQEVSYTYQGPYLATISCQNLTHSYLEYDLEGHPTLEKLPGHCGYKKRIYDLKGRLNHLETNYFSQDLAYDPLSNLISLVTKTPSQNWEETFSYDSLNQLSTEPSGNYTHDSIGNRLSENRENYSYDALNQRFNDLYDPCGCLLQAGLHQCRYDSLDRLIQLDDQHLNYDAFHRREDLLYDGQLELGNQDALRILAINAAGDIGAVRLIFLSGEPFIPIMDHLGSIVALVTPEGVLCESCRYSAFGIPSQESMYENPWGFCSKRKEGELLLFGYRYYHPQSGRWISPDPSGHADGPNLYAYCRNNPLGMIDPFGLKGFKEWCSEKKQAVKDFFTRDRDKSDRVSSDLILRDPELEERQVQGSRIHAGFQVSAGLMELRNGGAMCCTGVGIPAGLAIMAHGADQIAAGATTLYTGHHTLTVTERFLQGCGMPSDVAAMTNDGISIFNTMGSAAVLQRTAVPVLASSTSTSRAIATEVEVASSRALREVSRVSAQSASRRTHDLLRVGEYSYTNSAGKHALEVGQRGAHAGRLSRPFMRSPHTINEIMQAKPPIPDPGKIPGALRWEVPGSFRGEGTWELVIHPETGIIYHFNFK